MITARHSQADDDVALFVRSRFSPISQPAGDTPRVEVRQLFEFAAVERRRDALQRQDNVRGGVPFRFQESSEVFNVLGERSRAMIFKRVDVAASDTLCSLLHCGQHFFGPGFIIAQRNGTNLAARVCTAAPKGLGLLTDSLSN